MMHIPTQFKKIVHNKRAQILLPAVMLAPIFILVVYLLFETSKLSMTKVRQQFALDNGAYSQMSATSGYLNAVAMVNGPLPYRVMQEGARPAKLVKRLGYEGDDEYTVFDAFYMAGAFPVAGPNKGTGQGGAVKKFKPSPESNDWGFSYYGKTRANWEKENPSSSAGSVGTEDEDADAYVMTIKEIADNYFFSGTAIALPNIKDYLTTYLRTGSIYKSHTYSYKDIVYKSRMFRESYWLNTKDCTRKDCGKQAAATLDRYILETVPFEISEPLRFYVTGDYGGASDKAGTYHSGSYAIPIYPGKDLGTKFFQFAYLNAKSRKLLKQLSRGVVLKQKYKLPDNRFNINLTQRYQPYVRNTISVSCPRRGNNCVWPNPISKYSVKVGP